MPVGGARLRSFLIRLAISDGRPVPVDRLAEDLWAADRPADAANAVQALVSRLRGVTGRDTVEHGPAGYRLAVPPGEVDAWAFEQLVGTARGLLADGDNAGGAAALRQALGMWRGPALADVADAPFAAATIARLSELRLAALEDRIDADLALGHGAELVPEIEEVATAHPLRERLRGQLMRALYAAGRQADALGVYEDTRRALATSLGVDPSPALAAVHLAILRGELPTGPAPGQRRPDRSPPNPRAPPNRPAAGPAAGAVRTPEPVPRRQTNLPAQLTSFVGRDDELARVAKLLAEARLVTLTGPGGAGKTRLSVEAAGRLADQAPDGVWFVPLAPVRDALDVPQAVLVAIGAVESLWPVDPAEAARLAALEPLDRLADVLAAQRLVLVLDNCEHVVDAVARLAARVLADAPGVRILATSREPLGLTGETLCPVPSLPLPPPDAGAVEAAASPAVRLFADRAAAVRPGFTVDAETAGPVVADLPGAGRHPAGHRAGRGPGARADPGQVADRLDDRFALLSVGSRAALPRHQTLRAIVDWSWELLDGTERTVLRRLSVFSGGATPESAEQVCSLDGEPGAIVDVIASLVDKSLVTAEGQRQVRYRLLETVRAYAADRLAEAGEADRAAAAHAGYFLDLAEQAEPQTAPGDQLLWLDRLTAEHDNCSAALRYVIAAGDVPSALRFVGALAWFWIMRDYDAEAGEWAAAALRLAGGGPPPGLADAYAICEIVATISQAAAHDFTATPRLRDACGQLAPVTQGSTHPLLTLMAPLLAMVAGDRDAARRGLAAAAAASRSVDPGRAADVQRASRAQRGAHRRGGRRVRRRLARFRELGDRWGLIVCLTGQAEVALARGAPGRGGTAAGGGPRLRGRGAWPATGARCCAYRWAGPARRPATSTAPAPTSSAACAAPSGSASRTTRRRATSSSASWPGSTGTWPARGACWSGRRRSPRPAGGGRTCTSWPPAPTPSSAASPSRRATSRPPRSGTRAPSARWRTSPPSSCPATPRWPCVVEGIAALSAARGEHARAAELLGLAHTLQGFGNDASLEVKRAKAAIAPGLGEARSRRPTPVAAGWAGPTRWR